MNVHMAKAPGDVSKFASDDIVWSKVFQHVPITAIIVHEPFTFRRTYSLSTARLGELNTRRKS